MKHPLIVVAGLSLILSAPCGACAEETSASWLAQIEASLAATAQHLNVESAQRKTRVNTTIRKFRGDPTAQNTGAPVMISLPADVYIGGSAAHEGRMRQFELSERVRMKREAMIYRAPER